MFVCLCISLCFICIQYILHTYKTYTHIYNLCTYAGIPVSVCVCIFVSLCYLKLIFPLMLHLEVLSSCGQFLGSEI